MASEQLDREMQLENDEAYGILFESFQNTLSESLQILNEVLARTENHQTHPYWVNLVKSFQSLTNKSGLMSTSKARRIQVYSAPTIAQYLLSSYNDVKQHLESLQIIASKIEDLGSKYGRNINVHPPTHVIDDNLNVIKSILDQSFRRVREAEVVKESSDSGKIEQYKAKIQELGLPKAIEFIKNNNEGQLSKDDQESLDAALKEFNQENPEENPDQPEESQEQSEENKKIQEEKALQIQKIYDDFSLFGRIYEEEIELKPMFTMGDINISIKGMKNDVGQIIQRLQYSIYREAKRKSKKIVVSKLIKTSQKRMLQDFLIILEELKKIIPPEFDKDLQAVNKYIENINYAFQLGDTQPEIWKNAHSQLQIIHNGLEYLKPKLEQIEKTDLLENILDIQNIIYNIRQINPMDVADRPSAFQNQNVENIMNIIYGVSDNLSTEVLQNLNEWSEIYPLWSDFILKFNNLNTSIREQTPEQPVDQKNVNLAGNLVLQLILGIKNNPEGNNIPAYLPAIQQLKTELNTVSGKTQTLLGTIHNYIQSQGVSYNEALNPIRGQDFTKMVNILNQQNMLTETNIGKINILEQAFQNASNQIRTIQTQQQTKISENDAENFLVKKAIGERMQRWFRNTFSGDINESKVNQFIEKEIVPINNKFKTLEESLQKDSTNIYNEVFDLIGSNHPLSKIAYSLIPSADAAYSQIQQQPPQAGGDYYGGGEERQQQTGNLSAIIQFLNQIDNKDMTIGQLLQQLSRQ